MHADSAIGAILAGVPLAVLALASAWYLTRALAMRGAARPWPAGRTLCFLGGAVCVALALLPPVMAAAHHDLRLHMVQHLLLGMLGPLLLVLAAPVTLALRSLEPQRARLLVRLLRSGYGRALTRPDLALLLNVGGMYLLYLTPLFALSGTQPWLHAFVHLHFLLAGYVFSWAILAGPDQAGHAWSFRGRLAVAFLAIAAHAVLAKLMYAQAWPRAPHVDLAQIRAAAQLMYYGGDFVELLLLAVLFLRRPRHGTVRETASLLRRRTGAVEYHALSPGPDM